MSVSNADVLLEEAAAFIAVADSGDAETSALEQAAIRIEQAMLENPALTQVDVAERVGKSVSYVDRLLRALRGRAGGQPFQVNWGSGTNSRAEKDKRALAQTKPEELIEAALQAIEKAPLEKRQQLVQAVTDTSTVAGRHIENTVVEKQKKTKKREPEPLTGLPIPAYMATMVVKMNDWANGLAELKDDLGDLPECHERDLIADAARRLGREAYEWVEILEPSKPELRIIENRRAS